MPRKIKRFVEFKTDGDETGRTAYAYDPAILPTAPLGRWVEDARFGNSDDIMNAPGLKQVIQGIMKDGYKILQR